jgi:predicted TIM-barrel fold metal-dependent hydrolase
MVPGTHHALILFFDQYMTLANRGGGWIAHWMDRLDEFTESYGWQLLGLSLKPSEYFLRQCYVSFDPGERTMAALAPRIGADRMLWSSDFPHSDAKYPGVVAELRAHAADLAPETRAKLFGANAVRMYGIPAS